MSIIRPPRLRPGDTVAVLSPSWGGPALFPHVFDAGLAVLRDTFGLRVREYPTTRAAPDLLAEDPAARARDVAAALTDPDIRAIFASIGGDDSMLLLPHLDPALFRAHPKILMGYSDTDTLLVFGALAGVVTFHGPAVMSGFAQMPALPPAFAEHVRALLFDGASGDVYRPYESYAEGYPDWGDPAHAGKVSPLRPSAGWRWLQGEGTVSGPLFGLPIVADFDVGHTDPQLVLPLGVPVEVDCAARAVRLLEPAVA